jgi:hypothetical protein
VRDYSKRIVATLAAAAMMGLGIITALAAFVNLYNIDEQPRWLLAGVGLSGGALFVVGLRLAYRPRRSRPLPTEGDA